MLKFDWSRLPAIPMESVKFQKNNFFVILFQKNAKKKTKQNKKNIGNSV